MKNDQKPEIILVGPKEYADKWGFTRKAVHHWMRKHLLTIFHVKRRPDKDGNERFGRPKLNLEEKPPK